MTQDIDFIVAHIYALWNGKTLENAMEWTDQVYREIQKIHSEKHVVIGEAGWATKYNPAKTGPGEQRTLIKGEVSVNAQKKFLIKLNQWINEHKITTFLFEAFDEPWKGGGENSSPDDVEKHWGVFYEDRTPKESFQYLLRRVDQ